MSQFNKVVREIPQALSVYINQIIYDLKRQGRKVITLSLGEAFFDIPKFDYNDIDLERGYHYSDSLGLPSLRDKIAGFYRVQYKTPINPTNEIMITAGSKPAIFMCMLSVISAGDEVLIHEPAWLSYEEQAKLVGGKATFIPYNKKVDEFSKFINDKTKILIINNPNNPQGKVYSKEELIYIYDLCVSKGIFLLVDEAYSDFVTDDEFVSIGSIVPNKDNLFIVNSLSKNFGMSGWRIGYVIADSKAIEQLLKLNQHLITCAPTLLMMYVDKHFEYLLSHTLPQAIQVTEKRNKVIELIKSKGLKCLDGGSTFYIFLNVSDYSGSTYELAMYLLAKFGIAVVPGEAYGDSTADFIRISVGAESLDTIDYALDIIKKVIQDTEITSEEIKQLLKDNGISGR